MSGIKDWSTTATSNNAAAPNGWPEGQTMASVNDCGREMMSALRYELAAQDTIASATTCDLGTKQAHSLTVTGTTTITGLGTVSAGIKKNLKFDGALTFTHNATSLILPGGANITTAAGDTCEVESLGSGNWRCNWYVKANGEPIVQGTVAIAKGGTGQTTATAAFDALAPTTTQGDMIYHNGTDNVRLPKGTASQQLRMNSGATAPEWFTPTTSGITLSAEQAATSGTAIDFTGIPAGTKRIKIMLNGVSLSGTNNLRILLGDSGGFETTGYNGSTHAVSAGSPINFSAGFDIDFATASAVVYGTLVLDLQDSSDFTWIASGIFSSPASSQAVRVLAGQKALSAELTQVRVTTNGADTFDLGSISISYE